ncbi:flagellar biosynthesis anti-sigma factor FlgM [Sphingomonas adhaesiva]|uniref:flagellar biosynthesis anti-sigma factor FlgM n=1 Tax=Sphingomonas adhaesiva TaxID=28212 RepID=UPI002FF44175
MVDSVSTSTIKAGDLRAGGVLRAAAAAPVAAASTTPTPLRTEAPVAPETMARTMASSAPVDVERVQAIKTAIANGTFPLSPATIADQLIALKYDWMSNE